ncbi:MAG TPA: Bax inhibitor-1 family protein [Pirellulales bacterium]|nr:Bax inhibitor-1 family protein [Pirellulales bacterium]
MSYAENPYRAPIFTIAAQAAENERADFIRKTYLHLAGAVFAFTGLEAVLLHVPGLSERYMALLNASRYSWLAVLGAFMFVSYFAEKWARSAVSASTQYMGLGLYVAAEAVLFLPLLYIAKQFDPQIIPTAGVATLVIFTGLTAIVILTGRDFSFLRSALWLGGLVAMGAIVVSVIFPQVVLGIWFSAAMIFTTRRTCCTTTASASTWLPRWRCLPRWPCCSGTSCGS